MAQSSGRINAWILRPFEVAYLLNPAFLAVLLTDFAREYKANNERLVSLPLMFLVLPIVLHEPTRNSLPWSTRISLADWLESNPQAVYGYADRAKRLAPYTREAIIFAIQKENLQLEEKLQISVKKVVTEKLEVPSDSEFAICRDKSRLVGRWFAQINNVAATFRFLGVKP